MGKKIEYLLVKKKDDFCNTIDQFKNLLLTNTRIAIENEILTISKCKVKLSLIEEDIIKAMELSFFLKFEALIDNNEEKEIQDLEIADKFLRRIIDTYSNTFFINTIWDDVSTYYATKLYPQINSIENKLRKIIYVFMIRNLGSNWVEKNIPKEVKESIKQNQEKNNIHNMLEDCLYSADFIQLGKFLFEKYPIDNNIQNLLNKLKQGKQANLNEIIDKYESKSNWDRYFSDEIKIEKLLNKWEILYSFRNKVAHSKKIDKDDYIKALDIIKELDNAFDLCLERVNHINIADAEHEAVEEMASRSIEENLINDVIYANSARGSFIDKNGVVTSGKFSTLTNNYGINKGICSLPELNVDKNGVITSGKFSTLTNNYGINKGICSLPELNVDKNGVVTSGKFSTLTDNYGINKGICSLPELNVDKNGVITSGKFSTLADNYGINKGICSLPELNVDKNGVVTSVDIINKITKK